MTTCEVCHARFATRLVSGRDARGAAAALAHTLAPWGTLLLLLMVCLHLIEGLVLEVIMILLSDSGGASLLARRALFFAGTVQASAAVVGAATQRERMSDHAKAFLYLTVVFALAITPLLLELLLGDAAVLAIGAVGVLSLVPQVDRTLIMREVITNA